MAYVRVTVTLSPEAHAAWSANRRAVNLSALLERALREELAGLTPEPLADVDVHLTNRGRGGQRILERRRRAGAVAEARGHLRHAERLIEGLVGGLRDESLRSVVRAVHALADAV